MQQSPGTVWQLIFCFTAEQVFEYNRDNFMEDREQRAADYVYGLRLSFRITSQVGTIISSQCAQCLVLGI